MTVLRVNPKNCVILGCMVDTTRISEPGEQSRDISALNRWFELRFGFRTRFNMTWRNISAGNKHLCEKSGIQALPGGSSLRLGAP